MIHPVYSYVIFSYYIATLYSDMKLMNFFHFFKVVNKKENNGGQIPDLSSCPLPSVVSELDVNSFNFDDIDLPASLYQNKSLLTQGSNSVGNHYLFNMFNQNHSTLGANDSDQLNENVPNSFNESGEIIKFGKVVPIEKLNLNNLMKDNKMIMCPVCGRSFPGSYKFKRHYIIHTGEKPFGCSFCPFRCNHKDNLKVHVVMKHTSSLLYDQTRNTQTELINNF